MAEDRSARRDHTESPAVDGYRKPELRRYGDIQKLTRGGSGQAQDGVGSGKAAMTIK